MNIILAALAAEHLHNACVVEFQLWNALTPVVHDILNADTNTKYYRYGGPEGTCERAIGWDEALRAHWWVELGDTTWKPGAAGSLGLTTSTIWHRAGAIVGVDFEISESILERSRRLNTSEIRQLLRAEVDHAAFALILEVTDRKGHVRHRFFL